jgi:hypothetical protein
MFGYEISGTVALPTDSQIGNPNVEIRNLDNGDEFYTPIENGAFSVKNLEAGNYTLEVMFYSEDGNDKRFFSLFVNPDGTYVDSDSIDWEFDEDKNSSIPDPSAVTTHTIADDYQFDIDLSNFQTTVVYNLTLNVDNYNESIHTSLFVPRTSNYYWNYGDSPITFEDIEPRNGYYLSVWADGMEFYYNSSTNEFERGVDWIAVDSSGSKVCPVDADNTDWNCNWSKSYSWTWKPDIVSYDLTNMSENESLTLSLPPQHKMQMSINFGVKYADSVVYVDVYDAIDWGVYKWTEVTLDSSGQADLNVSVPTGDNYRVAFYIESDWSGYVLNNNSGTYETITPNQSWNTDDWTPKASTLIAVSADMDIGEVTLPSLNSVSVNITGLDDSEYLWLSLDGDNGYYGKSNYFWNSDTGNSEYKDSLELSVPDGDYILTVSAYNHESGYATDSNGDGNFTSFSWSDRDNATVTTVDSDTNFTITLPSNADLRSVSGTVTLQNDLEANGWLEIYNGTDSVGSSVNSDGSFNVEGVKDGDNYKYRYSSWENQNIEIVGDIGTVDADQTGLTIEQSVITNRIYGSITGNDSAKAVLISRDGDSWQFSDSTELNSSSEYIFEGLSDGIDYLIGAGVEELDATTGAMDLTIYNATESSGSVTLDGIGSDNTITVTYTKEQE